MQVGDTATIVGEGAAAPSVALGSGSSVTVNGLTLVATSTGQSTVVLAMGSKDEGWCGEAGPPCLLAVVTVR